jgi:hypothetical protein
LRRPEGEKQTTQEKDEMHPPHDPGKASDQAQIPFRSGQKFASTRLFTSFSTKIAPSPEGKGPWPCGKPREGAAIDPIKRSVTTLPDNAFALIKKWLGEGSWFFFFLRKKNPRPERAEISLAATATLLSSKAVSFFCKLLIECAELRALMPDWQMQRPLSVYGKRAATSGSGAPAAALFDALRPKPKAPLFDDDADDFAAPPLVRLLLQRSVVCLHMRWSHTKKKIKRTADFPSRKSNIGGQGTEHKRVRAEETRALFAEQHRQHWSVPRVCAARFQSSLTCHNQ